MTRKLSALHRSSRVRADLAEKPVDWYRIGDIRNEVVGAQETDDPTTRSTADVYVYESIGGWFGMTADDFVRDVAGLDVDHLNLHLNSPGGDVFEGVAMANVLRQHRADVTVWVDGLAASAASVVAMAGDEIVMGVGAQFMVHDAWSYGAGDAADLRKTAETLDSVSDSIAATYAARAGGTAAEWRAVMVAERWYTAEEAVTAGLADRVATDEDKGSASGEQIVPGASSGSLFDWWDSASAPERHAATVEAFFASTDRPQTPAASAGGSTPKQEGAPMPSLNEGLRQRLGFADDADEATLLAAVDKLKQRADEPKLPSGAVAIEENVLAEMRAHAEDGRAAREQQRAEYRDRLISAAVTDGRIAPARREHWATALAADPEGAEAALKSLAPGLIPVAELGHAGGDATDATQLADGELDQLAAQLGLPKEALQ